MWVGQLGCERWLRNAGNIGVFAISFRLIIRNIVPKVA